MGLETVMGVAGAGMKIGGAFLQSGQQSRNAKAAAIANNRMLEWSYANYMNLVAQIQETVSAELHDIKREYNQVASSLQVATAENNLSESSQGRFQVQAAYEAGVNESRVVQQGQRQADQAHASITSQYHGTAYENQQLGAQARDAHTSAMGTTAGALFELASTSLQSKKTPEITKRIPLPKRKPLAPKVGLNIGG